MNYQEQLVEDLRNYKRGFGVYVVEHGGDDHTAYAYGYADNGEDALRIDIHFPSDQATLYLYSTQKPSEPLGEKRCSKNVHDIAHAIFDLIDPYGTLADYDDFEEDESLDDDERVEAYHDQIDTFIEDVNNRVGVACQ